MIRIWTAVRPSRFYVEGCRLNSKNMSFIMRIVGESFDIAADDIEDRKPIGHRLRL